MCTFQPPGMNEMNECDKKFNWKWNHLLIYSGLLRFKSHRTIYVVDFMSNESNRRRNKCWGFCPVVNRQPPFSTNHFHVSSLPHRRRRVLPYGACILLYSPPLTINITYDHPRWAMTFRFGEAKGYSFKATGLHKVPFNRFNGSFIVIAHISREMRMMRWLNGLRKSVPYRLSNPSTGC